MTAAQALMVEADTPVLEQPNSELDSANVAIVHDYLNQRGGAERVVMELANIWPEAPIYTSLYRSESTFPGFKEHDVRATVLDHLPVDRAFRNLFPLYPGAFRMLGEIDADVVIASSSGWAHLVRPRADALHVVYCHSPARWLYGREYLNHNGKPSRRQAVARPVLGLFRRGDRRAAARADLYLANSEYVQRRIKATYGIEATVVPPPVDVGRFRPTPRGERLLVVARLLPYKHVELVIRAATHAGIGLDVVGEGPLMADLREIAGPSVTLHGGVSDEVLVELMEECRAVCVAAEEDFGLVAVEAQAAGKPVIAYGRGGSLENIDEGVTGVFFDELTEDSLLSAIAVAETLDTTPERIADCASRFSCEAFHARLGRVLEKKLQRRAQLRNELAEHSPCYTRLAERSLAYGDIPAESLATRAL